MEHIRTPKVANILANCSGFDADSSSALWFGDSFKSENVVAFDTEIFRLNEFGLK